MIEEVVGISQVRREEDRGAEAALTGRQQAPDRARPDRRDEGPARAARRAAERPGEVLAARGPAGLAEGRPDLPQGERAAREGGLDAESSRRSMLLKLDEVRKRRRRILREDYRPPLRRRTSSSSRSCRAEEKGPTHLQMERESTKFRFDQLTLELQKREESMRKLEARVIPSLQDHPHREEEAGERLDLHRRRRSRRPRRSWSRDARRSDLPAGRSQGRGGAPRGTIEKRRKQNERVQREARPARPGPRARWRSS